MTRETLDLDLIADVLLSIGDPSRNWTPRAPDREIPIDFEAREEAVFRALRISSGNTDLLRSECHEVCQRAKLTERQQWVLEKRLDGYCFERIGRLRSQTKQAAQRTFIHAIKKIARSYRVYPYGGLAEVYASETRRGR